MGRGKGATFLTSWLLPFHTRVYSYREQSDPMRANSFLEDLTPIEMEKKWKQQSCFLWKYILLFWERRRLRKNRSSIVVRHIFLRHAYFDEYKCNKNWQFRIGIRHKKRNPVLWWLDVYIDKRVMWFLALKDDNRHKNNPGPSQNLLTEVQSFEKPNKVTHKVRRSKTPNLIFVCSEQKLLRIVWPSGWKY